MYLTEEISREGGIRELYQKTGIIANEDELFLLGPQRERRAFVDTYIVMRLKVTGKPPKK